MSLVAELLPSAGRLMSSLRDIGYDAPGAIADLVDNSIDANARHVRVDIVAEGDDSFVRVSDDGIGMTRSVIEEAMRFGSRRKYGSRELGAFGLGLKTASLSQARCLTVATRTTERARLQIRRWDLDHVMATDRWELETPSPRALPPIATDSLRNGRGTVVLWQRLDRLVGHPASPHAPRMLDAVARRTAEHLGMVLHRFISGEAGGSPVEILVNGQAVPAWDPFARHELATRTLPTQRLQFEHNGRALEIAVSPFVLPAQHRFSTVEAHATAAGPNRWNRQQGLYIYRRERLIQAGGWNRLRTLDEHSKLARVAVDLPAGDEDAFGINVSKMQVNIPEALRPPLRALIGGVVQLAQDVYRQHGVRTSASDVPRSSSPTVANEDRWDMGGDWPHITTVLRRELAGNPRVLDRILVSLVNVRRAA